MNPQLQATLTPKEVTRILVVHAKRWLVPAAVVGLVAIVYAVVRPDTWEASQALIIRNEAATNNNTGPGKFEHTDEMKTVQETILELVRSRGVLRAALEEVGAPADYSNKAAWPTGRDIAELRDDVKLVPPKGAEFGKTEVFYLRVRDHDNARSIALNLAISEVLQGRFQRLRDVKAQSMIDELVKTVELAKTDLGESTVRLTAIETQVGSDLAELRALQEYGAGNSALHQTVVEIRNELRDLRGAAKANRQLLALLRSAQDDPGRLVATPSRLLESQPALKRLKDGLVDAQLKTASLKGRMSNGHPLVINAKQGEEEIGSHLHNELEIAIRGLEVELRFSSDRLALLEEQLAQATGRLDQLAGLRATYANQAAETVNRTELVKRAEQNLAEARATHASANATNLLSRIDAPDTGIYPVGPGRATIAGLGIIGGLLVGFGVLFLTIQPNRSAPAPQASSQQAAAAEAPSAQPATEPGDPAHQANGALSFKETLKVAYGSKA